MNKSILITGVPGSGKSTICKKLNELGHKSYGIEKIKGLYSHINKETGRIENDNNNNLNSVKEHQWICNKVKLKKLINSNKGTTFYCGTASNINEIIPFFDKIFLLKPSKKILEERLIKRKKNDFGHNLKIRKWVLGWKRDFESSMIENRAVVINSNKSVLEMSKEIVKKINS